MKPQTFLCAVGRKKFTMSPQKNIGQIEQRIPRYVDPSMPVWLQVIIGFFLGVVVGYCWAYNALGGG